MSKEEKNKERPQVGCRVIYACEKDKLIRRHIADTLALIALFCNPLVATFYTHIYVFTFYKYRVLRIMEFSIVYAICIDHHT